MACASCSVIADCAHVGAAKPQNKPMLIKMTEIARFIARSVVPGPWTNYQSRYWLEALTKSLDR